MADEGSAESHVEVPDVSLGISAAIRIAFAIACDVLSMCSMGMRRGSQSSKEICVQGENRSSEAAGISSCRAADDQSGSKCATISSSAGCAG